jgi:16S rRNA (cytosine1402-N4)-methyltransferase
MRSNNYHESVLVDEVTSLLDLKRFARLKSKPRVIDATVGTGGHLVELLGAGAEVLGIDLDASMLKLAQVRLKGTKGSFKLVQGNFRKIDEIARENGFDPVQGIIFDLGVSNIHFKADPRGFSFEDPQAQLDMRLDPESQGVSAMDLLNALRQDQLETVFGQVLEAGNAREIARRVLVERQLKPFATVGDFLKILGGLKERKLHSGTRAFLALRIAVNSELENLKETLPKAFSLLAGGGRLAVISFHSGEDGAVKDFFREAKGARVLTPNLVTPGWEEISRNPRSRSAKLRVLEKI